MIVPDFLSTEELARRWGIKPHTVEKYRDSKKRKGPPYVRIEGNVRYKLTDIESYEQTHKKPTQEAKE